MSKIGCLAFVLILGVGTTFWFVASGERKVFPGVAVAENPVQGPVLNGTTPFSVGEYQITPLASYAIRARVLGRENYRFDHGAKLSPVDLALGWGRMSDYLVYHPLGIKQRGRFYLYTWGPGGPPIPRREIETHSANNHLIPANSQIAGTLKSTRTGDIVVLKGQLVEARGRNGFLWRSSLTREDTGGHSCELMYVTDAAIEPPEN